VPKCYSVCPGWCGTSLDREVTPGVLTKLFVSLFVSAFRRSASRGAECALHACVEEALKAGALYKECKVDEEETLKLENMREEGDELWKMSERIIDKVLKE